MALRFAAVRNRGTARMRAPSPAARAALAAPAAPKPGPAESLAARAVRAARGLASGSVVAVVMGTALGATACQQAPSAESLREWTPADHHSNDDDKLALQRAQQAAQPAQGARSAAGAAAKPAADPAQIAQLVDVTWRQQCANCHGPGGHGDGQMGPMLHATDLTSAEWQGRTSDADMAMVIKAGKNRMPRFDLPDSVVAGLVARIRSLRAAQ
jgi:cytochrome c oxidase cbb3-type subunit 3